MHFFRSNFISKVRFSNNIFLLSMFALKVPLEIDLNNCKHRKWKSYRILFPSILASNWHVLATTMECLLISPLNYIQNTNFPLFSFLKYRDFRLFVISIFVVVKENVVNSKYIFVLFLVFFFLSFFVIFRASLSELQYLYVSPFLFCSFKSIYLSTYQQSTYQSVYTKLSVQVF